MFRTALAINPPPESNRLAAVVIDTVNNTIHLGSDTIIDDHGDTITVRLGDSDGFMIIGPDFPTISNVHIFEQVRRLADLPRGTRIPLID